MPSDQKHRRKRYQVPALKRAFAILDTLNQSSFGVTAQQISEFHKIPYSTAFYLLETMHDCGYVQKDETTKRYTLGYKLFAFRESSSARANLDLRAVAQPLMQDLTERTGLTVHLAILEQGEAVYIEKTEPAGFIRLNTWVGKRNPLHCTAVGKALLMLAPESEVRSIIRRGMLVRRTDRTIASLAGLMEDLARARRRGYALDDREDEPEGRCVAAPLLDRQGRPVASMGLAGTISQIEEPRIASLGQLVAQYAGELSRRLGYVGERAGTPHAVASASS